MYTDFHASFEADHFYHVYNRSNGTGRLFFNKRHRRFFLRRLNEYSKGVFDIWAYALIPNHFHVLIRVKGYDAFQRLLKRSTVSIPTPGDIDASDWVALIDTGLVFDDIERSRFIVQYLTMQRWRCMLLSYSKAINKDIGRHGSLFQKVYKRKEVSPPNVKRVVQYIHRNPIHHGLCDSPEDFEWSSYNEVLGKTKSTVSSQAVLEEFDGAKNFIQDHQLYLDEWYLANSLEFTSDNLAKA